MPIELGKFQYMLQDGDALPWFSYNITWPLELPLVATRPHLRTKRLVIRPFEQSDAEALHELRSDEALQKSSHARGKPDTDLAQTRQKVKGLQTPNDDTHWYFGAFLQSTGELIGEGGLPDTRIGITRSGWPEADFLIATAHQRQGYGTEFFRAVMDSWWDLPRERMRRQLHPATLPGIEPGEKVTDHVVIAWEDGNKIAANFFTNTICEEKMKVRGGFEDYDMREGRGRAMTKWYGFTMSNPVPFIDKEEDKNETAKEADHGDE